jgi:hypothetical protein
VAPGRQCQFKPVDRQTGVTDRYRPTRCGQSRVLEPLFANMRPATSLGTSPAAKYAGEKERSITWFPGRPGTGQLMRVR